MNKKTLSKIATSVSLILFLTAIISWGYTQLSVQEKQADIDLYTLIPAECDAILETRDINALYNNIRHSCFNREYNDLHVSELLSFLTGHLESFANQQAHGLSSEMSQLLVSFHHPGSTYDQVVYGRMSESDKTFVKELMQRNISPQFPPKTLEYKGERITIYPLGKEFLACYFQPGFFAVSLQKNLIEKVIDAHKENRNVCSDARFERLRKGRKRNEPLTLYLHHPQTDIHWMEFDIRMNAEAIYLTGGQATDDTCRIFGSPLQEQLALMSDAELPGHIQMMYQLPFVLAKENDPAPHNGHTLEEWLEANECREVDVIMFTPQAEEGTPQQLLTIPLTTESTALMRQELKRTRKAIASYWVQGQHYPVWSYEGGEQLPHYFITPPPVRDYCLTFYKDKMLVATAPDILLSYLREMTALPQTAWTHNRPLYQYCLNDLAEEANFTLVADMSDLMEEPLDTLPAHPTRMLPTFFFKHKEFFRNFMLSTQFIYTNGQINTNLILTYQGDSLLRKSSN